MPNQHTPYDQYQRRCPRLGHSIHFHYCRIGGDSHRPCFKVFDCWWEYFDVVGYFKQRLTDKAFQELRNASPPDEVASLIDVIRQARKRTGGNK